MAILDKALSIARPDAMSSDFLPVVLLETSSGELRVTTIVADGSDRAAAMGRAQVRARDDATSYVIVTRTNLVTDEEGTTVKVLLLETAGRGDALANRYAWPLPLESARQELESVPSAFNPVDPQALSWGPATPDRMLEAGRVALHVLNHELSSENVERTLRFVQARIRFHRDNLPAECSQAVFIDDRGQVVPRAILERMRRVLSPGCSSVRFASER